MGRVEGEAEKVRRFGEFAYAAKTWHAERRVIARVEASDRGADSRFVVTNLAGTPRWLYEAVYCARGQAENLIKAHKLPPRLGPDLVQQGHRQPVPAGAAHRRLLAPAHPARLGAEEVVLARGPVRHDPPRADQGGRAGSPSWRPGSSSRCRPAIPTGAASCCSPPGPRGRPEPRGGVPRPSPSSATHQPRITAPPAPQLSTTVSVTAPSTLTNLVHNSGYSVYAHRCRERRSSALVRDGAA